MFLASRRVLALLFLLFAGVFLYFRFHHEVSGVFSALRDQARSVERLRAGTIEVLITGAVPPGEMPALPDISRFNTAGIAAAAPAESAGEVRIADMADYKELSTFLKKDGALQSQRIAQRRTKPQAIIVASGNYGFARLYREISALAPDGSAIAKTGNVYTLRLPVYIARGASLTISGGDTAQLRLSQERRVFIAGTGDLFILRTRVTGWSERQGAPSTYRKPEIYRPFITAWSGARLYIAGSVVESLGYFKGKSYGITYSTCPECLAVDSSLPPPSGALADNIFRDIYYGFYSYEAAHVAIVGNTYADNIIYGIDPHDRSHHLIIAGNEVYGTRKKHGIILSRQVDDSWIFGNNSHDNEGSGIMLDRSCSRNVIANNFSTANRGDGVTFYESSDNTTWENSVYGNGMSGLRVRNSQNIRLMRDRIVNNGHAPIVVYTSALEEVQKDRNLREDPYREHTGAVVTGAIINAPHYNPVFKVGGANPLALSDINVLSENLMFSDAILDGKTQTRIQTALADASKQVVIVRSEGKAPGKRGQRGNEYE